MGYFKRFLVGFFLVSSILVIPDGQNNASNVLDGFTTAELFILPETIQYDGGEIPVALILHAIDKNNIEKLKDFLNLPGFEVNHLILDKSSTFLIYAINRRKCDAVKILIEYGAYTKALEIGSRILSPLMVALTRNFNESYTDHERFLVDCLPVILQTITFINTENYFSGFRLIPVVIQARSLFALKRLLDKGINTTPDSLMCVIHELSKYEEHLANKEFNVAEDGRARIDAAWLTDSVIKFYLVAFRLLVDAGCKVDDHVLWDIYRTKLSDISRKALYNIAIKHASWWTKMRYYLSND